MEAPQAQWLWPHRREKKQGKKAPGGLKTLKVLNNFGPAGRQNPPRAAKFDHGGVHKLEFAGGTPSPHKRAQGKEAAFLYRPNHEKAFAAAKGGHDIEAKAIAEDDSDDDEGASVGRPWTGQDPDDPANWAGNGRKTRAIKGGRGAAVGTGRPKVGQDPDNPADRAGDGLPEARPAKVPPKSGRGIPIRSSMKTAQAGTRSPLRAETSSRARRGTMSATQTKTLRPRHNWPLESRGSGPAMKQGPRSQSSQAP
jgi:hypothetical protein